MWCEEEKNKRTNKQALYTQKMLTENTNGYDHVNEKEKSWRDKHKKRGWKKWDEEWCKNIEDKK